MQQLDRAPDGAILVEEARGLDDRVGLLEANRAARHLGEALLDVAAPQRLAVPEGDARGKERVGSDAAAGDGRRLRSGKRGLPPLFGDDDRRLFLRGRQLVFVDVLLGARAAAAREPPREQDRDHDEESSREPQDVGEPGGGLLHGHGARWRRCRRRFRRFGRNGFGLRGLAPGRFLRRVGLRDFSLRSLRPRGVGLRDFSLRSLRPRGIGFGKFRLRGFGLNGLSPGRLRSRNFGPRGLGPGRIGPGNFRLRRFEPRGLGFRRFQFRRCRLRRVVSRCAQRRRHSRELELQLRHARLELLHAVAQREHGGDLVVGVEQEEALAQLRALAVVDSLARREIDFGAGKPEDERGT